MKCFGVVLLALVFVSTTAGASGAAGDRTVVVNDYLYKHGGGWQMSAWPARSAPPTTAELRTLAGALDGMVRADTVLGRRAARAIKKSVGGYEAEDRERQGARLGVLRLLWRHENRARNGGDVRVLDLQRSTLLGTAILAQQRPPKIVTRGLQILVRSGWRGVQACQNRLRRAAQRSPNRSAR